MKLSDAKNLIDIGLRIAKDQRIDIAIAIVDRTGETVCFARSDNVSPQACRNAQSKAFTSAQTRAPSSTLYKSQGIAKLPLRRFTESQLTGIGGGVPIFKRSEIIAGLGVGGLSEEDDERIAHEILNLGKNAKT